MRIATVFAGVVGLSAALAAGPLEDAQDAIRLGDYDGALNMLAPVLKSEPKNVQAQFTAAAACIALKEAICGREHLDAVAKLAPETPGFDQLSCRLLLVEADLALRQNDEKKSRALGERAVESASKALAQSPGQPKLLALRAMALRAAGRTDDAIAAYKAWCDSDPRNPDAYGAAAAMLVDAKRWDDTAALLGAAPNDDAALRLAIDSAVLRNGLGRVPWSALQPLFDSVRARNKDPQVDWTLNAYHTFFASTQLPTMLQALDYLDADPADTFGVGNFLLDRSPEEWKSAVGPDVAPPVRLSGEGPKYPEIARRARIEGIVIVAARVRKDGSVGSIHVLRTSNAMFVDAAVACVQTFHYSPATQGGVPFEVAWKIRIDFRLRG